MRGTTSGSGGTVAQHGCSCRFAFLFAPGSYDGACNPARDSVLPVTHIRPGGAFSTSHTVDVPVGYYTHVVGLGESPDAVEFTGPKGKSDPKDEP